MTTTTLPRLATGPSWPARLLASISLILEGVLEAREIAARYERLQRMSNAELEARGLTRDDIPAAAVNGIAGL